MAISNRDPRWTRTSLWKAE